MGASNPYKKYESTVKNDDKWQTFLKTFNLSALIAKRFFAEFRKMDKKAKGEITFQDYAKFYKIAKDDHPIMERFFKDMKKDRSNGENLYYQEFVLGTYDFATLDMDGIVELIFRLYDPQNTGFITYDVYKQMCMDCMGPSYTQNGTPEFKKATLLFRDFAKSNSKKFTKTEFRQGEKSEGSALLFAAILEFQEKITKKFLNSKQKGWKEAQKVRQTVGLGRTPWIVYSKGGSYVRPLKGAKSKKTEKVDKKKVGPAPGEREDD